MDSIFMQKVRGKLAPGSTEGGFSDVGTDANAASLQGPAASEDYAVSVVNRELGDRPFRGAR